MANYTMTLYDLLSDEEFELFDFYYNFYTDDESRKKEFEQKFIMNYMRYEIGFETGWDFKHELCSLLNIKADYYRQLYESELKSQNLDFLLNKDLVEEFTRTLSTEANTNTDSENENQVKSKNQSSVNSKNKNEASGSDLDNGLSNADADKRKTSHSKDESNLTSSTQDEGNSNSKAVGNMKQASQQNTIESTRFVSKGNIGVTSSAELLEKWRKIMINIDEMLIKECRQLFATIYFSYSIDDYRQ